MERCSMSASVLVIDHDSHALPRIQQVLQAAGYRVLGHQAGRGVFNVVRREQPDVLLLDVDWPESGAGWSLLQRLRLEPATRDLPIVVCSADRPFLDSATPRLLEKGYVTLRKPCTDEQLRESVRQALATTSGREEG